MLVGMAGLTERIEASPDTGSLFLNSLPVDLVGPRTSATPCCSWPPTRPGYVTGLTMTVDAGSSAR